MASRPEPLRFAAEHQAHLKDYLPPLRTTYLQENTSALNDAQPEPRVPHVTLTYATSLDSQISLQPGVQTVLSGPETKAMTHYLRSQHDAILVGRGTAEADNPGLNSRFSEDGIAVVGLDKQPRPFVLDPRKSLEPNMTPKLLQNAVDGIGRSPWWIIRDGEVVDEQVWGNVPIIRAGKYEGKESGIDWQTLLVNLAATGVRSIMIEGGAAVINDLLKEKNQKWISSVIVTIAPTYLGTGGVVVSPQRSDTAKNEARLTNVRWLPLGQDVVMTGKVGWP
ncbi:riboflavin-specific deaminase domain-containing protein [Phlyctema vagabunda]|uniref:2,5-diamino-6-ribosylamino-4(3H)-pyrimidinone 5'-phosphate reductase n=1 Tax=Phlyctema vagabunda TaxID=108571 RepID=A0ABR4PR76_9HELO